MNSVSSKETPLHELQEEQTTKAILEYISTNPGEVSQWKTPKDQKLGLMKVAADKGLKRAKGKRGNDLIDWDQSSLRTLIADVFDRHKMAGYGYHLEDLFSTGIEVLSPEYISQIGMLTTSVDGARPESPLALSGQTGGHQSQNSDTSSQIESKSPPKPSIQGENQSHPHLKRYEPDPEASSEDLLSSLTSRSGSPRVETDPGAVADPGEQLVPETGDLSEDIPQESQRKKMRTGPFSRSWSFPLLNATFATMLSHSIPLAVPHEPENAPQQHTAPSTDKQSLNRGMSTLKQATAEKSLHQICAWLEQATGAVTRSGGSASTTLVLRPSSPLKKMYQKLFGASQYHDRFYQIQVVSRVSPQELLSGMVMA